jgi:hypothetical protein
MWGRGFFCIFPRDADSPRGIPKRLVRHHEFSGAAQSGGRDQPRNEKDNSEIAPCLVKKACNTHASPLPTWGQVKKLATESKLLLQHTTQPQTSEALFLAMVAILSCQVCGISGETYWAYFPNPPILHPVSWNDTGIKISTNDTALLGGL